MSDQERDEILDSLTAISRMLKWLGSGAIIACVGLLIVIVSDHYDQINIKSDVDILKPRVERLWWMQEAREHPGAYGTNNNNKGGA